MATQSVDLTIIGAGPAGLYAAYYAGFRGMRTAVVDSLPEPGGQVAALYPEKLIYDVAGFPAIKGQELIERCVEQAAAYDPAYVLGHRAETLTRHDDGSFTIGTHKGEQVSTRSVLITGGIGTFTPRPLPDAAEFEGRGLVYFVRELETMRDLDVLIVGGGDSAVDWALNLEGIARSITLIHRRDRFRAHEDSVQKLYASSVRVLTFTEVAQLRGADRLEEATVFSNKTDERETIKVQAVVAALGFTSDLGPLKSWDIEIDGRHVLVDTRMQTSIEGVFAAGDITEYEGKVRLIAVGFGEAATAVNNAAVYIDPAARVFPGHSSG
ncbi:NAD(P)/FAD-dependent oxidoreductase [Egicoccus halophilus]|uniref:Ferredoxin--NADP reductase n=1 Tax=Egicoccus halophilus TaxID=1670830 RepID=A0A8J3EW52_9ACTN|nr:NAD(P)/FAD-dependent oxidoreductase [Egicoccus halophilus]GGI09577.1 ferredoxin--NADP reductase [Egicoccus halophilus]